MRPEWKHELNMVHELWTPSPIVAEWYKNISNRPIYVYEHGVDAGTWQYKRREKDDIFRFLHVGTESVRKGGDIVLDAFRVAFPNKKDVKLTLKMNHDGYPLPSYGNLEIICNPLSLEELVQLHYDSHVFVYPSWGEGFGLSPLQAMATGMPTICTAAWAPYIDYIPNDLALGSKLVDSPWPNLHQGKMFKPDFDELVDIMRFTYEYYDYCVDEARDMVPGIVDKYDWLKLTKKTFDALEERIKNN